MTRRYDAAWSKLSREEMIKAPMMVSRARKLVREAGGSVIIKDWSYMDGGCSPSDVKGLVKKLRSDGKDIDMVIVDYLELMTPNRSGNGAFARREQRHVFGQQVKELRAMAVALQVPVISAWQINRQGAEVDTLDMQHLSECWDVNKHADIILALNQSKGELENRQLRIGVLKQRAGTARPQVYVFSDLDRCIIRDVREEATNEDDTIDATAEAAVL